VTHKVVRPWLAPQRAFNDACRNTYDLGVPLVFRVDMCATDLAETTLDIGRRVERNQILCADKTNGLLGQANPRSEGCTTEPTTLAAMAMDNALSRTLGEERYRAAVAAS